MKNRTIRKILTILLLTTMTVSATACGNTKETATAVEQGTKEQETIENKEEAKDNITENAAKDTVEDTAENETETDVEEAEGYQFALWDGESDSIWDIDTQATLLFNLPEGYRIREYDPTGLHILKEGINRYSGVSITLETKWDNDIRYSPTLSVNINNEILEAKGEEKEKIQTDWGEATILFDVEETDYGLTYLTETACLEKDGVSIKIFYWYSSASSGELNIPLEYQGILAKMIPAMTEKRESLYASGLNRNDMFADLEEGNIAVPTNVEEKISCFDGTFDETSDGIIDIIGFNLCGGSISMSRGTDGYDGLSFVTFFTDKEWISIEIVADNIWESTIPSGDIVDVVELGTVSTPYGTAKLFDVMLEYDGEEEICKLALLKNNGYTIAIGMSNAVTNKGAEIDAEALLTEILSANP